MADPGQGGIPRFVLLARLSKVEILNGSEVKLWKFRLQFVFLQDLIKGNVFLYKLPFR